VILAGTDFPVNDLADETKPEEIIMADLPAKVPGAPGTVYEATWGRKTMKSKTFTDPE
jgi:hypothetical protein